MGRRSSTSSKMTIVPGFIDTHAHWTRSAAACSTSRHWSFFANLAYGVTTGRDPQTGTNDMFAYQDLVDIGELVGPAAFSTGPGRLFRTPTSSRPRKSKAWSPATRSTTARTR